MADFAPILETILKHEGGYVLTNHANDRGGQTYAGISRKHNPHWPGWGLIDKGERDSELLRGQVAQRYRDNYWNLIRGDELRSDEVASSMMSCAVLAGPTNCIILAQMALGIEADGILGPVTMGHLTGIHPGTDEEDRFEQQFERARILRYIRIVEKRPEQIRFLEGWVVRAMEDAKT